MYHAAASEYDDALGFRRLAEVIDSFVVNEIAPAVDRAPSRQEHIEALSRYVATELAPCRRVRLTSRAFLPISCNNPVSLRSSPY
jgi:hypothetical protein